MAASGIVKQKIRFRKTFNTVASGLFKELGKLFPTHPKLLFLANELEGLSKDHQNSHIPAIKFFKSMNSPSGVPSSVDPENIAPLGELIINRDDRLFSAPDAVVPGLEAADFKMLWGELGEENRARVWDYLNRMAELSARVAALETLRAEDIANVTQLLASRASSSSNPGKVPTPEEAEAIVRDNPQLAELGAKLGERIQAL